MTVQEKSDQPEAGFQIGPVGSLVHVRSQKHRQRQHAVGIGRSGCVGDRPSGLGRHIGKVRRHPARRTLGEIEAEGDDGDDVGGDPAATNTDPIPGDGGSGK